MEFKIATTQIEIDACQNLLREVFLYDEGFSLTIPDRYESQSTYFYAKLKGIPVGCLRFVKGSIEHPLPLQEVNPNIDLKGFSNYAEVSRWVISRNYRGKVMTGEALRQCWQNAALLELDHVFTETRYKVRRLHERLGFRPYSKPFYDPDMAIPGEQQTPNAIIMHASLESLLDKHSYSDPSQISIAKAG